MREVSKEDLKEGTAINVTKTDSKKLSSDLYTDVAYDIVGEIDNAYEPKIGVRLFLF